MKTKYTFDQLLDFSEFIYQIYKSKFNNNESLLYSVSPKKYKELVRQIANKLNMSEGTAENYSERLFNLFNKLNKFDLHNGLQDCTADLKLAGENVFNPKDFESKVTLNINSLNDDLKNRINKAQKLTNEERNIALKKSNPIPKKINIQTTGFIRNEYVILAVLERANGFCEGCDTKAPFISKAKKKPYLEVHHIIQLANGGHDTIENSIALCPNCHRESHFGLLSKKLVNKFQKTISK